MRRRPSQGLLVSFTEGFLSFHCDHGAACFPLRRPLLISSQQSLLITAHQWLGSSWCRTVPSNTNRIFDLRGMICPTFVQAFANATKKPGSAWPTADQVRGGIQNEQKGSGWSRVRATLDSATKMEDSGRLEEPLLSGSGSPSVNTVASRDVSQNKSSSHVTLDLK